MQLRHNTHLDNFALYVASRARIDVVNVEWNIVQSNAWEHTKKLGKLTKEKKKK